MSASSADTNVDSSATPPGEISVRSNDRLVLFVLAGFATVYSLLLLVSELLPFVDLPFHLGVATVVREYGESGNQFSDYFTLQIFGQPNVFYIWFCTLSVFPSVEFANKVYFALYSFLLPLSIYVLIRELRGNTWFSLLSFLYLYNFNTHWGFVGFVGAMPAVFFLLTGVSRHLRNPTALTRIGIATGALLLFFIHVLAALFFLLVYGISCVTHKRMDRKELVSSLALMLPVVTLIGWWWLGTESDSEQTLMQFLVSYYDSLFFKSFYIRSFFFIFDNSYLAGGRGGLIWGGLLAGISTFFIAWAVVFERNAMSQALRNPDNRLAMVLVGAAFFCFFLLPEGLPGQWALSQRFSVYSVLGLIVVSSLFDFRILPRKLIASIILGGCLLHAGLYADYFRDFGIETNGFTEEILPDADGNRLAGLILEPKFRGTLSYLHFPNYYIVRKQGIAVSRMVDFRFGTIRRKPQGRELPEALMRFDIEPDYSGEYDEIDYLVVRGEITDGMWDSLFKFEEATRKGGWSLLVRR